MGYEGHAMGVVDLERRRELMESAMERLIQAHEVVGGDLVTGGGTGTHAINTWVNEIQAGSYIQWTLPTPSRLISHFVRASFCSPPLCLWQKKFAVCSAGLKAQGMDHGNPVGAAARFFSVRRAH